MVRNVTTCLAGLLALVMVVAAMWTWTSAFRLSEGASRADVILWALRSGAVALAAGAQAILAFFVVSRFYRRDLFCGLLRYGAGLIAAIAVISAIALGLAGR